MKPQLKCPTCEKHVEVEAIMTAQGRAYRCCNCHHIMTDDEVKTFVNEDKEDR